MPRDISTIVARRRNRRQPHRFRADLKLSTVTGSSGVSPVFSGSVIVEPGTPGTTEIYYHTCCLDLVNVTSGSLEATAEALEDAVQKGFFTSFILTPKREPRRTGPTRYFASILATEEQLAEFDRNYSLGDSVRWKGGLKANFPKWAKTTQGNALHRWFGIPDA